MLIKVIRKKDGFILEMPPYLANDKKFLEKNGLFVASDEVKKPPIQPVIKETLEDDGSITVSYSATTKLPLETVNDIEKDKTELVQTIVTKVPVKKGRKAKK